MQAMIQAFRKCFPSQLGRLYDVQFNRIMTHFFDMNLLKGRDSSTAEVMFNSIDSQLSKHEISWDNCVALGVGNTNANIGAHNSIKSRTQAKNDCVIVVRCPCWFRNSSKGKSILKEFNEFCDEEYANVIEHASTRSVSLVRSKNLRV